MFDWQGDCRTEVVFFPDYVDYRGVHYVITVVIFSRCSVEVKTKTANGNQGILDILMEIEDIVKIESLWCARVSYSMTGFRVYALQYSLCDLRLKN